MNRMLKVILPIILTLGLLVTGCSSPSEPSDARIGGRAPDFELNSLDGQTISLSDFKGKPVLLNFWASWCGPCVFEMPFLQEIYDEWSNKGLILLTVNIGDSSAKAKEFLQKHNLSLPVLLDTKKAVARRYNITAIPTTFFIDKDGIIHEKIIGAFPNKEIIEKKLSKIIT